MHEFNKEAVVERRESREGANNLLYWTNKKIKQWLNQIDLQVTTTHSVQSSCVLCACVRACVCVHLCMHS